MSLTYINKTYAYSASSGTSLDTSGSNILTVLAGDILVCWCAWESGSSTVSVSDTVNSFTMETVQNDGSNYGCLGYVLNASAKSLAIYTMTNGSSVGYRNIVVFQFRPTAGRTTSKDTSAVGNGNSASLQSNTITTTGTDEVVVGAGKDFSSGAFTSQQIGGTNADGTQNSSNYAGAWYRILSATASNIAATATGSNAKWLCHILAIKSVGVTDISLTLSETLSFGEALD